MGSVRLTTRIACALAAVSSVVLSLMSLNCAKKGYPEGGPPDKTPPSIVSTTPESGAVGVEKTAEIRIEFSEPVERTSLLPNLFISPPLSGEPETKWSKRSVRMNWSDTLRSDVTYRVTIGTKIEDRRRNRLSEAFTFAFSTGAQIDSGRIAGRVWSDLRGAAGVDVFAYRIDSGATWDPFQGPDSGVTPEFVTQTGETGDFDLPYLPSARFRILAVGDKNRNLTPDPNELIAIATQDVDLTTAAAAGSLHVFTQVFDTSTFAIKGCTFAVDGTILVGLTHSADTAAWAGAPFSILDSAIGETLAVEVLRPVPPHLTVIPVVCEGIAPGRTYTVAAVPRVNGAPLMLRDTGYRRIRKSSCNLQSQAVVDTIGPKVTFFTFPEKGTAVSPTAPIVVGFSEPVDTSGTSQIMQVYDTLGTVIDGTARWLDRRQLQFEPAAAWPETTAIVFSLDSALLTDRHGNPPPMQAWTWTFEPLTQSMMGAVSCRVDLDNPLWVNKPCRLEARPPGRDLVVAQTVPVHEIVEVPLPAGPWVLSAFIDLDEDGRFFAGDLTPFRTAEPRAVLADTLSVRARFTLEDIVIRF